MFSDLFSGVDFYFFNLQVFQGGMLFFSSFWALFTVFFYYYVKFNLSVIFFFYMMCFSVIGVVGYEFKYWMFILWSFFVLMFFGKMFGLLPYVYGVTTKIYFVLFFSLWGWATIMTSSFFSKIYSFIAHFCPAGSPSALGGFLSLVEVVSVGIRPGTLTLRLVANMTTGHMLMGLVTLSGCNLFFKNFILGVMIMLFLALYLIFEIAMSFIQGQVYLMLLKSYSLEHL